MRRALGKGLAQLVGEESAGAVFELPLSAVRANPTQPRRRFDPEEMAELEASVREHGILQPILVRPVGHERYEIVAGERRFRAASAAGLATVPAVVRPADARTALELALVENVQREDIGPLEAAEAYARLVSEFGLSPEEVAARVGKSRSAVSNTMRLLGLPAPVRQWLAEGRLTEGHARAALTAGDEARVVWVAERSLDGALTVRQAEALARAEAPARRPAAPEDPDWRRIADGLSERLGAPVRFRRGAKRSRLEIEFTSVEELERVLEAMGIPASEMA